MKIFIKYIKRSMFENKGRLFLLIFSIALSTGLLVVSLGTIDIIGNSIVAPKKAASEGKDIAIVSNTSDMFFTLDNINESNIENIDGEIRTTGIINNENELNYVNVVARENNHDDYIIEGNINNLANNDAIISKRIANERDLKLGDTLEININGDLKKFKIVAISVNEGLFYNDSNTHFTIIVDYHYLSDLFDVNGKYNYATASIKSGSIEDAVKSYNEENDILSAQQLYSDDGLKDMLSSINSALYAMFSIVILISVIIIYGAFKLTIAQRLPIIGTFFSQGASHFKVESILFVESIGYGMLGGIVGAGLGIGGLYLVNYVVSPLRQYGIITPYSVNLIYPLIGIVFAVFLAFISALLPIRSVRKLSEKDIILNKTIESSNNGWIKFIIGIVFLALSITCNIIDAEWTHILSMPILFMTLIGLILVRKKIVEGITILLAKLVKGKCNILFLALNNVRTSKVLLDSMMLVIISLASALLISSMGTSLINVVKLAYEETVYDVNITNNIESTTNISTTDQIIEKLKQIDSVDEESINPNIWVSGYIDGVATTILGVDPIPFANYMQYLDFKSNQNKDMYTTFENSTEFEIIVASKVLKNIDRKVGDTIPISINDITHDYKIIGEVDAKLLQSGIVVIMNNNKLKDAYNITEATTITVETSGNKEEVRKEITDAVRVLGATTSSIEEDTIANIESNNMIVMALSLFSYIAIIISAIGIFNNITIGFLQRKREFAILCSIGMSNKNRIKLLVLESFVLVILSCMITVPAGFILMQNMTKLMSFIGLAMEVTYNFSSLPMYLIGTTTIVLIATIPVLVKSKKIEVVQELKLD